MNHDHARRKTRIQLLDNAKNRILKAGVNNKRSKSRHRHSNGNDDDCSSYEVDVSCDIEQGNRNRRNYERHQQSIFEGASHQTRAMAPQQVGFNSHSEMKLKSPSHFGPDCQNQCYTATDQFSPFMIPPDYKLSPRSDVWLLLSISSVATLSSLAMNSTTDIRSILEQTALISSSLLFTMSFIVGFGFRYAPFRETLTHTPSMGFLCLRGSNETIIAIFSLVLSVVVTSIVMNPDLYIAMGGNSVWNANAFFSCWAGLYTCFYLVGDLFTANNPQGLVEITSNSPSGLCYFDTTARIWYMLLGSSLSFLGVSFDLSSSECSSSPNSSPLCERAFAAGLLSILSVLLNLVALAVYRMSLLGEMNRSRLECFNGAARAYNLSRRVGSVLSFLVFVLQSTIVGVVSSPSGPGLHGGSVFLTAWLSFGLSLMALKRYMESFCVPFSPSIPKRSPHLPVATNSVFHDSFRSNRSAGTNATEPMEDSYKVADDERQEQAHADAQKYFCIEEQKPTFPSRQDVAQHLPSVPSSSSRGTRSQTLDKLDDGTMSRTVDKVEEVSDGPSFYIKPLKPAFVAQDSNPLFDTTSTRTEEPKGLKASFSSNTGPVVFMNNQSDVSTLGVGSILTREHREPKSSSSYYGGMAPDSSARVPLPARQQKEPSFDEDSGGSDFLYSRHVPTKSGDNKAESKQDQGIKGLQRRSSYSSIPSLPAVQEASLESSSRYNSSRSSSHERTETTDKSSRRSVSTRKSKSSSKISKCSSRKNYKHKVQRKGSEGSSTSNPRTIDDHEYKLHPIVNGGSSATAPASDFSIVCDSNSIITEITTEGFDESYRVPTATQRQQPRLPSKNPLYNGSDASTASGQATPRLNAFDSSVDDLVFSALQYARKSREPASSHNASARTITTLSPGGPSCSSVQSGYQNQRRFRAERSNQMNNRRKNTRTNIPMRGSSQSKRRGSIQSLYSNTNSADGASIGMDFAC